MVGEGLHLRGAQGAADAKRWLDRTTRVDVRWVNPNPMAVPKLTFSLPNGNTFSFDIGGLMRGGDVDGAMFLAEVKNYTNDNGQGPMYEEFLAKCYRAFLERSQMCDNFMFITWAPFKATTWSSLTSSDEIKKAVKKHWKYNFDSAEQAAAASLDQLLLEDIASRLWLLVLSAKQIEHLSMSTEHLAIINEHETRMGG